eukprot:TRINITY_DN3648_c0_g1_i7.p2 TRINITY_DN3648_c0_g1~~TRINITY_DN3648_c0_g1_i7.p2  ORF type:complete len:299 (+),score=110.38 TRINITY_DN3648_c0_g1_i7:73-969(+)
MMQRFKMIYSYRGTSYLGWQRDNVQKKTIQSTMESAIQNFSGHPSIIFGSSRTDSGVHALGAVAHVDIRKLDKSGKEVSPIEFKRAVNAYLSGEDIIIQDAEEVPSYFHARFTSKSKTYKYRLICGNQKSLFCHDTHWMLNRELDFNSMQEATKLFVGKKDFSNFRGPLEEKEVDPFKNIQQFDLIETELPFELANRPQDFRSFEFITKGEGFLKHQVRAMVGSLVRIGEGGLSFNELSDLFQHKKRGHEYRFAPPQGLYLWNVEYPPKEEWYDLWKKSSEQRVAFRKAKSKEEDDLD